MTVAEAEIVSPEGLRRPLSLNITTLEVSSFDQVPDTFREGLEEFVNKESGKAMSGIERSINEDRDFTKAEIRTADDAINHEKELKQIQTIQEGKYCILVFALDETTNNILGFSSAMVDSENNEVESFYLGASSDFSHMGRVSTRVAPIMLKALMEKGIHEFTTGVQPMSLKLAERSGLNIKILEPTLEDPRIQRIQIQLEEPIVNSLVQRVGIDPKTNPFHTSYHVKAT